jgi:hypothetical protein
MLGDPERLLCADPAVARRQSSSHPDLQLLVLTLLPVLSVLTLLPVKAGERAALLKLAAARRPRSVRLRGCCSRGLPPQPDLAP